MHEYARQKNEEYLLENQRSQQPIQFDFWLDIDPFEFIQFKSSYSPLKFDFEWLVAEYSTWANLYEFNYSNFYVMGRPYYIKFPTEKGLRVDMQEPEGTLPWMQIGAPWPDDSGFESSILEDLLWGLRATRDQVAWITEIISFQPSRVMRQDDNGHTFEVAEFESLLEARWHVEDLEKLTHKQAFWAEPIQPS
jgi:hypothetical protein